MRTNKVVQNVAILAGLFLFILGISCLINNSNFSLENMQNMENSNMETMKVKKDSKKEMKDKTDNKTAEKEVVSKEGFQSQGGSPTDSVPGCLPKDQLMPQELLPQDNEANQWSSVNPQGSGSLMDKNFLQSGYHVGINTVGQTLRNANLQLRSDPPNPQVQVSPWIQSTISPDTNRKPFEIGGSA